MPFSPQYEFGAVSILSKYPNGEIRKSFCYDFIILIAPNTAGTAITPPEPHASD